VREKEYPGTFIVIEGADGAGTTTISEKVAEELDAYYTYEPSGNAIGEKVDELISSEEYSAEAIALGFAADRMVHLEEEIVEKLENGKTVVCDRYYHSSLVYQPLTGLSFDWVKSLNRAALTPDITVILDISADTGMGRIEKRGRDDNIFEELSFQEKVVAKYRELGRKLDEKIENVDASKPKEEVLEKTLVKIDSI